VVLPVLYIAFRIEPRGGSMWEAYVLANGPTRGRWRVGPICSSRVRVTTLGSILVAMLTDPDVKKDRSRHPRHVRDTA
jgi:hypothetical protein